MKKTIVGIQGGRGSYNEVALSANVNKWCKDNIDVKYLFSSSNVVNHLISGSIKYGQLAIRNSVGGYVNESMESIADLLTAGHGISVVATYEIPVTHCLMAHKSSAIDAITTIISHPQALKQCQHNLNKHFSGVELIEGQGDFSDPAKIADTISAGGLGKNIATLSNPYMAEIYDLDIISKELQDSHSNKTTFLLLEKL